MSKNLSRDSVTLSLGIIMEIGEGGLPVERGGSSLLTHMAGTVTTQSIAFKYVMASEPYMYNVHCVQLILKTGHGRFAIH
jgi:hypothetical protein